MINLEEAQAFSVPAFILNNGVVNENSVPITFTRHAFLARPYVDNTPRVVARKCGQVGFSTMAILRAFHLAKYTKANVIYTLPSRSAVKDFVAPKVNPLILNNKIIGEWVAGNSSTGSTALKQIGERFIYFRGSWEESSAISISAHILFNDEVDRSNQSVLRTYRTRLDAAKLERPDLGWEWKFSNPSVPGMGVDEWWQESDQKHWFIRCSHCNKRQFLDWPDSVDLKLQVFICKYCKRELRYEDRLQGAWIPARLGREISGYWYSQLMAPWVDAKKIIDDSKGDQAVFHNFTLGKPFISKDLVVSRETLVKCLYPTVNPQTEVVIGVDNGIKKHYVVGNRFGIFRIGVTEDWDEIENMRNLYNAIMVIDQNPYPTPAEKLVRKYRGKVFVHNYFTNIQRKMNITEWGEGDNFGRVASDRTRLFDLLVAELNAQEILFNMSQTELENEGYITHWLNMYRTTKETAQKIQVPYWETGEGKPDHYAHATALWRVGTVKTLSHGAVITTPTPGTKAVNPVVAPNQTVPALDMKDIIRAANTPSRSWKTI